MNIKRSYTIPEASRELNVSRRTMERMINRGEIRVAKVGKLVRVHSQDIDGLFQKKMRPTTSDRDND